MEDPVNIIKGMLCGLIFIGGIVWQIWIYKCASESEKAKMVTFGIPFGGFLTVTILCAIGVLG